MVGLVYTRWGGRYVLNVRETRANHLKEYSTWSNPIMAKEQVVNTHMLSCNECYDLKYCNAFEMDLSVCKHGYQLGFVVIYLVFVTNPQMFVGWLHGDMWCKPFTPSIQWCIVILMFHAFLLVEVTRNIFLVSIAYTWWISYRYFEVNQEDSWLNFQCMGQSKSNLCCWISFW